LWWEFGDMEIWKFGDRRVSEEIKMKTARLRLGKEKTHMYG
jgi:hypothetical protein